MPGEIHLLNANMPMKTLIMIDATKGAVDIPILYQFIALKNTDNLLYLTPRHTKEGVCICIVYKLYNNI